MEVPHTAHHWFTGNTVTKIRCQENSDIQGRSSVQKQQPGDFPPPSSMSVSVCPLPGASGMSGAKRQETAALVQRRRVLKDGRYGGKGKQEDVQPLI